MRNHAPILLQQIKTKKPHKTKLCYYIIKLRENKTQNNQVGGK